MSKNMARNWILIPVFAEFGRLLSNIGFNILAVSYKGVSVTL